MIRNQNVEAERLREEMVRFQQAQIKQLQPAGLQKKQFITPLINRFDQHRSMRRQYLHNSINGHPQANIEMMRENRMKHLIQ